MGCSLAQRGAANSAYKRDVTSEWVARDSHYYPGFLINYFLMFITKHPLLGKNFDFFNIATFDA